MISQAPIATVSLASLQQSSTANTQTTSNQSQAGFSVNNKFNQDSRNAFLLNNLVGLLEQMIGSIDGQQQAQQNAGNTSAGNNQSGGGVAVQSNTPQINSNSLPNNAQVQPNTSTGSMPNSQNNADGVITLMGLNHLVNPGAGSDSTFGLNGLSALQGNTQGTTGNVQPSNTGTIASGTGNTVGTVATPQLNTQGNIGTEQSNIQNNAAVIPRV